MELIYTSPESIAQPEGAISSLRIDGFVGILPEYKIETNLKLTATPPRDSSINIEINNNSNPIHYDHIEHIYAYQWAK